MSPRYSTILLDRKVYHAEASNSGVSFDTLKEHRCANHFHKRPHRTATHRRGSYDSKFVQTWLLWPKSLGVWRFVIAYVASSASGRPIVVYREYRHSIDRKYDCSIEQNRDVHRYCSISKFRRDREMRLILFFGVNPPLHVHSSRRVE